MPLSKVFSSAQTALADMQEGAVVLIGGFGSHGVPETLLRALQERGVGGLTVICQSAGGGWPDVPGAFGLSQLVANGQVRRLISPLPVYPGPEGPVQTRWQSGELEIEVVPMGTLAERLRAGGAGLGGFFLPTGVGTRFQLGKERQRFGGRDCILELPLHADFALLRAHAADHLGNLVYRGAQRNWNPVMAMAAAISIAEVDQIHEPGGLSPEAVITPGIYVHRIVKAQQRGRYATTT